MFILSFFISFVRLVVILLILCVIPFWDSAPPHSPSSFLQLNPFFRQLHIGIPISLYSASSLFGTKQHLIHTPVKSSTLPFTKRKLLKRNAKTKLYSSSNLDIFKEDLENSFKNNFVTEYSDFQKVFLEILHKHAPIKKKILRFNDKSN